MTGTFETTFISADNQGVELRLTLNADKPELVVVIDSFPYTMTVSPPCLLQGEALGKLIAWLQEPEYKLPR